MNRPPFTPSIASRPLQTRFLSIPQSPVCYWLRERFFELLAGKDVGKAIADRAAWRDDERRWCRERKLPKPGWWE